MVYIGGVVSRARLRHLGAIVIATGWLPGASAAFLPPKVFTSADPRERLEAIARRRGSWRAHNIGFPAAFFLVAVGFGLVAAEVEEPRSRRIGFGAAALQLAAALLWLPISARRVRLSNELDALLLQDTINEVEIGGSTFWPYTLSSLGAIAAFGSALALSGLRRHLGLAVGGAATLALALLPVLRDWPPFMSGIMTTTLGVGLLVGDQGEA